MFTKTAFDVWREEETARRLISLCPQLDAQLGGGIEEGKITEFCGGPGTGKTQLCLQLCLTVQFPIECSGVGGKAVFIDTNQDFSPNRLKELAEHMSRRFQRLIHSETYNVDNLLENVSYIYCKNFKQLLAHLLLLRKALESDSKIKLIVIDSFSNLIRNIRDGVSKRTRLLYRMLTDLHQIANKYHAAVVITNELTTHFSRRRWIIRPALGSIHLHKINSRIILSKVPLNNTFCALSAKSAASRKINIPIQEQVAYGVWRDDNQLHKAKKSYKNYFPSKFLS